MLALPLQPRPELAGRRGLSRPLQAQKQNDPRRRRVLAKAPFSVTKQREQLVAHNLDDLLSRRQALEHRLVHRPVTNPVDKRLDDLEIDRKSTRLNSSHLV